MEIVFNVSYLAVIYAVVGLMSARLPQASDPQALLLRFRNAFLLLALGDTGHVGLRVIALLRGGLESKVEVAGVPVSLVGIGSLATAITVTFFYLVLLDAWRAHFHAERTMSFWTLMAMGVVRLLLFLPEENRWSDAVPPFDWSLVRNVPLMVLGLGVAGLFIRDGRRQGDATFTQLGVLILLSYAFYLPVIFFVQRAPWVGVLMIPKTVMYLVMAWLAYARLFNRRRPEANLDADPRHRPHVPAT
jgi:hypothetical protein